MILYLQLLIASEYTQLLSDEPYHESSVTNNFINSVGHLIIIPFA